MDTIVSELTQAAGRWVALTNLTPKVCYLGREEWGKLAVVAFRDFGFTLMPWHNPEFQGKRLIRVDLENHIDFGV